MMINGKVINEAGSFGDRLVAAYCRQYKPVVPNNNPPLPPSTTTITSINLPSHLLLKQQMYSTITYFFISLSLLLSVVMRCDVTYSQKKLIISNKCFIFQCNDMNIILCKISVKNF